MTQSGPKGKSYERKIAHLLSTWCGFQLIRTPMSGGWQGTAGDIIPKDRSVQFPFVIECKNRKAWCLEQVLAGTGPFADWVTQCEQEIIKDIANGHPVKMFLLIFTRNNKPDYIALPMLHKLFSINNINYMLISTTSTPVVVLELKQFFAALPYQQLISTVESTFDQS